MANQKPVHEIRLGKVKAAIWKNETDSGTRYSVTTSRLYKPEGGEWESTNSFGRAELPLVSKVADMVSTWIYQQSERRDEPQGETRDDRPAARRRSEGRRERAGSR